MKKILLLLLTLPYANTLLVPSEFNTIQGAINSSVDADTVLVSAGTYYEKINFEGKNIVLIGEDRETTIIDGEEWGAVVTFENNEGVESVLSSFTIQNGYKSQLEGFLWPYNYGGGIYCQNSSPRISNCIIKDNNTLGNGEGDGGGGAGMFIYQNSSPLLEDVYFYNNSGVYGGALYIYDNSSVTIESCLLDSNLATLNGGAIHVENSILDLHNSYISNNTAENGGGISLFNSNGSYITETSILNNNSNWNAGGIYVNTGGEINIFNNLIKNNSAVNDGGGLLILSNSYVNIENTAIVNNLSTVGGGIVCGSSSPLIENSTIAGNVSENTGGGILSYHGSNPQVNNSIIAFNLPEEVVFRGDHDPAAITLNYSNVLFGEEGIVTNDNGTVFWGSGNIDNDPGFYDLDNGDFTLQFTSPCIDTGDPNSPLDPDGTRADMGAYPFFQIPGCMNSEACNYNINATEDDGSCNYAQENYDCDGNCIADVDCLGECGGSNICGCTDLESLNYDETANINTGCLYLGDVNGDLTVDIADVVTLVAYVVQNEANYNLETIQTTGEINNDGIINVIDVVLLVNIIVNQ